MQNMHLKHRDFYNYNRFRKKSFTGKWWLSSKVKALNFTENKLLKVVSSMKADFLYAGVHANIIIKKKKRQKKAHFLDKSVKIRGIKYINVENRLLFAPPPIKTPGYAPGYTHPQF